MDKKGKKNNFAEIIEGIESIVFSKKFDGNELYSVDGLVISNKIDDSDRHVKKRPVHIIEMPDKAEECHAAVTEYLSRKENYVKHRRKGVKGFVIGPYDPKMQVIRCSGQPIRLTIGRATHSEIMDVGSCLTEMSENLDILRSAKDAQIKKNTEKIKKLEDIARATTDNAVRKRIEEDIKAELEDMENNSCVEQIEKEIEIIKKYRDDGGEKVRIISKEGFSYRITYMDEEKGRRKQISLGNYLLIDGTGNTLIINDAVHTVTRKKRSDVRDVSLRLIGEPFGDSGIYPA